MYGCNNKQQPEECRILPLILSKINKVFNFEFCKFGVQKTKESTARVCLYKELKTCPNIFTIESTFSGIDFGDFKGEHITTAQLASVGRDLCRSLLVYGDIKNVPEITDLYASDPNLVTPSDYKQVLINELLSDKKLLKAGDGDSSGGSDSEPSEDNLPIEEAAKVVPILEKAQKLRLERAIKLREDKEKEQKKVLF